MRHMALIGLIIFCGVGFVIAAPARIHGQQTNARIDALNKELALIRHVMADQEKRVSALEEVVRRFQEELGSGKPRGDLRQSGPLTSTLSLAAWQVPGNWDRLKSGMSESQVISILGPPTNVDRTTGSIPVLFYKGEVPGSGVVSGNVKLMEDRVYLVNKPVF